MNVSTQQNPVGNVVTLPGLQELLQQMLQTWSEEAVQIPWWQVWKTGDRTQVVKFLVKCLDDLVNFVAEHNIPGPDKKATVLDAIGKLYDTVVAVSLPFFLRPFSGMIKNFVVNTLIAAAIDWIVEQYQNGNWRPKTAFHRN